MLAIELHDEWIKKLLYFTLTFDIHSFDYAICILSIFLMIMDFEILPNHTSYRRYYFTDFVHNSFHCNMNMILFDLRSYGGCYRPKKFEGVDFLKKSFRQSCSMTVTSKIPNQIWAMISYVQNIGFTFLKLSLLYCNRKKCPRSVSRLE